MPIMEIFFTFTYPWHPKNLEFGPVQLKVVNRHVERRGPPPDFGGSEGAAPDF